MSLTQTGKPVALRGLVKSYGGAAPALAGIDLDIEAGSFCTLLGASGSGKTTLLKTIAGFETPDRGEIRIGSRDIAPVPVARRNIGMVFQNYALFPHLTVARNVAFGLEMRKLKRAEIARRVEAALALVSLDGFGGRSPRELSGGQQQRVALARALVIEPDILLMDEPLGALDKNLRQAIQVQLRDLHRRIGATIVYVTHDQEEALFLSDRIALMDKGLIVQVGTPQELYFRPANRFVATFLGECNLLPAPSGRGEIGLRPEKTLVGGKAAAADIRLDGTLVSAVFTGTGYRIAATVSGRAVTALVANDDPVAMLAPGAAIPIGYMAGHAMTLDD
ncbi:ABC transporter ATP-binding protein [Prosthecodimorpha staleyi]|uniref:ABC transporter ATP-binding protein n=1 Tax=Prosthecodimorpha staleyi TaxID=2840188 RepID=A0A947D2S8_9HYPH|nr:ABC transporter ATP-binding protein [Prosthecodimorpha staleyi]MBT9289918.1 ABC transporter ATP-binding protein [Prosthecodimorpha staleyi]